MKPVERVFEPGRGQPPYNAKVDLLSNGTYVLKNGARPGWNTDVYGHTPVWLVFDDQSRKMIKGGFPTRKAAIDWAITTMKPADSLGRRKIELTRSRY